MYRKIFFLICLLAIPQILVSQNITGVVIDKNNNAIGDVVVTAFSLDSTYLALTMSDKDGCFKLNSVKPPVILDFNHISYKNYLAQFNTEDLGVIKLESVENELQATVVTTYRRNVKVDGSGIIFDLKQMTQNSIVENAFDAISKLPGITEKDGQFQLVGAGTATVVINGKASMMDAEHIESYLKSLPIERIKNAKIMYLAPAEYGIKGPVIDLTMTREAHNSYSALFSANYNLIHYSSYRPTINFAISGEKLSADLYYSFNHRNDYTYVSDIIGKQKIADTIYDINARFASEGKGDDHSVRLNIDYFPKKDHLFTFIYQGNITPHTVYEDNVSSNFLSSINIQTRYQNTQAFELRYQTPFGLSLGANYVVYYKKDDVDLNSIGQGKALSTNLMNSSTASAYADMKHTITNNWTIDYGIKGSLSNTESSQSYPKVEGEISIYPSIA